MWSAFEIWEAIEYVRENPTEVQILAMLALVVLAVAALYMTFGQRRPIWLAYCGAAALPLLLLLILFAARQEPS